MSAFEVDNAHIDALVSAALLGTRHGPMTWYHGELPGALPGEMLPDQTEEYRDTLKRTKREVTLDNAGIWGATLLAENRRSVNHRYDEDEFEAPYEFSQVCGAIDPVKILSAIACYEYQSCEHPQWESSEAHSFCHALRMAMIRRLPGYGDAPWEVTDPKQVLVTARTPAPARPVASRPARTIPRNATRQVARLKSAPLACSAYTLDRGFVPRDVAVSYAWEAFDRGAKLRDNGDGTYTVRVHSNCWYELRSAS